jgi:diketogulonate reductase-like aldo/keto reductase
LSRSATRLDHAKKNLAAAGFRLTDVDMAEIQAGVASAGARGEHFPPEMLGPTDLEVMLGISSRG